MAMLGSRLAMRSSTMAVRSRAMSTSYVACLPRMPPSARRFAYGAGWRVKEQAVGGKDVVIPSRRSAEASCCEPGQAATSLPSPRAHEEDSVHVALGLSPFVASLVLLAELLAVAVKGQCSARGCQLYSALHGQLSMWLCVRAHPNGGGAGDVWRCA